MLGEGNVCRNGVRAELPNTNLRFGGLVHRLPALGWAGNLTPVDKSSQLLGLVLDHRHN